MGSNNQMRFVHRGLDVKLIAPTRIMFQPESGICRIFDEYESGFDRDWKHGVLKGNTQDEF